LREGNLSNRIRITSSLENEGGSMVAKILSGREISAKVRQELKEKVTKLKAKGLAPGLAMVRVGEDPASVSYVKQKGKTTEELGSETERKNHRRIRHLLGDGCVPGGDLGGEAPCHDS
jgi:hypothetical protein